MVRDPGGDADLLETGMLVNEMPVGSALYRLGSREWVVMLNADSSDEDALKEIEGTSARIVLRAAGTAGPPRPLSVKPKVR